MVADNLEQAGMLISGSGVIDQAWQSNRAEVLGQFAIHDVFPSPTG
ncbi:MAG TPA: hypothetical protein VIG90_11830 [Pedomonas sp.]